MKKILFFVAFMAVMVSCSTNNKKMLISNEWEIEEMLVHGKKMVIDGTVTLQLTDSLTFGGLAGCNSVFGVYTCDEKDAITFKLQGRTRMMCPNIEFEESYLKAIDKVTNYKVTDEKLVLSGKDVQIEYKKKLSTDKME